ncbi:hypothetical protein BG000_000168 [Podila horticola]|nr:hypothetical protein BG000_000168 [Podila horticola]
MADKRTREAFSDEDWDAINSRAGVIEDPALHPAVEEYLRHLWDSFGNKVIGESRIKVSRQLHDILCHRAQETKWSDVFSSEAKVVGFVTGGSMLTRMDLVFGGGRYTTVLKGHGLFKMAETLSQFRLSLRVAKFLLQSRGLIINLMTLFHRCIEDNEEDPYDEDEEQDYVNEYIASSPSGEYGKV